MEERALSSLGTRFVNTPSDPFVLLICNDLFFGSKITGSAAQAGVKVVLDSTATLDQLGSEFCTGVVLDMNHPSASPGSIAATAPDGLKLLAFGPHVRTELFEAASAAGFETVSRGQFDRSAGEILESLSQ